MAALIRHFTVSVGTTSAALSATQAAQGIAKVVMLQADGANTGIVYVGANADTLSSTNYGHRIEVPVSTVPAAPTVIEAANIDLGALNLIAATTTQKIHVMVIYT